MNDYEISLPPNFCFVGGIQENESSVPAFLPLSKAREIRR
jgi:hypothetical protein